MKISGLIGALVLGEKGADDIYFIGGYVLDLWPLTILMVKTWRHFVFL